MNTSLQTQISSKQTFIGMDELKTLGTNWGYRKGVPNWVLQRTNFIKIIDETDKDDQ